MARKKIKNIYAICDDCSKQLYPDKALDKDCLSGITVHEGNCDICGNKSYLVPLRDFWYALTNDEKYWD